MTNEQTIYVVEDDDAVRDSLQLLLESVNLPVRTFSRGDEFLAWYDPEMRGCILLDIRMPGINGVELHRQLNEMLCILPIIFVTGHGDVPMAVEAIKAGASDFIQKPYREQELLDKILLALKQDETAHAELGKRHLIEAQLDTLTPREREVLDQMVEGQSNKNIAHILGISQRTVEIHRARVMEKLNTKSVAQLVRKVLVLNPQEAT